jgi:cupin fold WbuC family metalloprotein
VTRAPELRLPQHLRAEGPDVFYCSDAAATVLVGKPLVEFLKTRARLSVRKRSRLCAHDDPSAALHEMLIVHHREVYVRPHRHAGKAESIHCIEGAALIVLFEDDGSIRDTVALGDGGNAAFFCRIPAGVFHTLLIRSEWLVFHETTCGPFDRSATQIAPWSPADADEAGVAAFVKRLEGDAAAFLTTAAARSERY